MEFDELLSFDIVCSWANDYLILIPRDLSVRKSFKLTRKDCLDFGLEQKFIDTEVLAITGEQIVRLKYRLTGFCCLSCHTYAAHSEPNRVGEDGKAAFICWNCRNYPFYR